MKRLLLIACLLPTPLLAKDLTVTMDEQAWAANIQMLDQAVRAQGLASADAALFIKKKIEDAAKAAGEAPAAPVGPPAPPPDPKKEIKK